MSDLMQRAAVAARRAVARRPRRRHPVEDDEQLADEYARALGMHLSLDDQAAWFKQHTEGAPFVQRPVRRPV